jgi:phosphatidylglycerol lysyltransferase
MKLDKDNNIFEYLKSYGDFCLAFSTTQPILEYFHIPDIGYLSYIRYKHILFSPREKIIILGNPICHETHYISIINKFLIIKNQPIIFLHHDERLTNCLKALEYKTNMFGTETILNLPTFTLKGKSRAKIRQWLNKASREQIICEEIQLTPLNYQYIKKISEAWLSKKKFTNFGILTRPLMEINEADVRFFIAKQHNQMIAFAGFDPMYQNQDIIGYYHNFDRMLPSAPNGTGAAILIHAMNKFHTEGIKSVSLGLSPLYKLKNYPTQNKFTLKALRFTFKNFNFIYPFKGNASHKKKFDGRTNNIYFSSKNNSIYELLIILFALSPNSYLSKHIFSATKTA